MRGSQRMTEWAIEKNAYVDTETKSVGKSASKPGVKASRDSEVVSDLRLCR